MTPDHETLMNRLAAAGDADRAAGAKRYLKSDLTHLGLTMGDLRAELRRWIADRDGVTFSDARALWERPEHEARMAAVEIAIRIRDDLDTDAIVDVERWLREARSWAYVDALAVHVAGPLLDRHPDGGAIRDRWATDPDFWMRRSAMLSLLADLRAGHGDFERFGRYADAMLEEREFFIRKAIGWILRDTGRKRPDLVYQWILPRAHRASGVTMREVRKCLDDTQWDRVEAARHG